MLFCKSSTVRFSTTCVLTVQSEKRLNGTCTLWQNCIIGTFKRWWSTQVHVPANFPCLHNFSIITNTEIIVPGVLIIQQYITTVSNCYLFDRLTVVLTVRSATSITTSSTPGNSLISFFFTENKMK